jgi:hypothetical protein
MRARVWPSLSFGVDIEEHDMFRWFYYVTKQFLFSTAPAGCSGDREVPLG